MPHIQYECPAWLDKWVNENDGDASKLPDRFHDKVLMIKKAIEILEEYDKQDYRLTLRQLYYQFVARDLLPNSDKSYKKLGQAVSDGRMWGLIDWDFLVDRGRNFHQRTHWERPSRILEACARSFSVDRWRDSPVRFEVWVEKQALEDIVAKAVEIYDVGYIACKGYMSKSEMWAASQRLKQYDDQELIILHLGDHDPSGIDMTRDIQDQMNTFRIDVEVRRIALNMDQIRQYNPPPNPAKVTDSRSTGYIERFGSSSWELDALEPSVIVDLIRDEIDPHADSFYTKRCVEEEYQQNKLCEMAERWDEIDHFLKQVDLDNADQDEED